MIVIICFSPALDIGYGTVLLKANEKTRTRLKATTTAAGAGPNIARVYRAFGVEYALVLPLGGEIGHLVERLAREEGLNLVVVRADAHTRTNANFSDETANHFNIVQHALELSEEECKSLLQTAAEKVGSESFVIVSGSLPAGCPGKCPNHCLVRFSELLKGRGNTRLVVDLAGAALRGALASKTVYHAKMNLAEASEYFQDESLDSDPPNIRGCADAAKRIVLNGGAQYVTISLGKYGAVLVSQQESLYARLPPRLIGGINRVLSGGDTYLAMMTSEMAAGHGIEECLRMAIGAATAVLQSPDGRCRPDEVRKLAAEVLVDKV